MIHVFLLTIYLGAGDTRQLSSNDMYFRSVDRCNYFASRVTKVYGNYGTKDKLQRDDYVTAYCIPKKVDPGTTKVYEQEVSIDPITAVAAATSAFNFIKKGISVGKDIESMYGQTGKWMGAISDINHADKMNKKPPLFKKLFNGSSIEQEAMEIFAAKKKAEAMETELRNFVNLSYGPNAWNEILRLQGKILKDRQRMIYDKEERWRKIMNWFWTLTGMFVVIGVIIFTLFVVTGKAGV